MTTDEIETHSSTQSQRLSQQSAESIERPSSTNQPFIELSSFPSVSSAIQGAQTLHRAGSEASLPVGSPTWEGEASTLQDAPQDSLHTVPEQDQEYGQWESTRTTDDVVDDDPHRRLL